MAAGRVVRSLDVVEHVGSRLVSGPIGFALSTFGLERREEALYRRSVPEVAERLMLQTMPWSAIRRWNCSLVHCSGGRRNTMELEVAISIRRRRLARSGRAPLPSPSRRGALKMRGHFTREIGRVLGRAAATISRELRPNAASRSGGLECRATTAPWHADRSARRPKLTSMTGSSV